MTRTSRALLATALAVAIAACAGGEPGRVDASEVNAAMAEVSRTRQQVAAAIDPAQRVAVRLPDIVAGMRSPSSVDDVLEQVPAVAGAAAGVDPATFTPRLDELDAALEAAREALDDVAPELQPDSWQAQFVTAQAEVVGALGRWSEASRTAAQPLAAQWEVYARVAEAAATLDEDRWLYRSPEEAAGTWEIAIADDLAPLEAATEAVAPTLPPRDEAAAAVAAADDEAEAVYAARPGA